MDRQSDQITDYGVAMRGWSNERPYFDSRDAHDLEHQVTNWFARQESSSRLLSILVLSATFLAMVLFAASR
jgi:hypothetical protein